MHCHTIWQEEIGRPLTTQERHRLAKYELPEPQLRYLLREYKADAVYPNLFSFCMMADIRIHSGNLPEDITCAAFLSNNDRCIRLAEELETLRGAWTPTKQTEERMAQIRSQLFQMLT